MASRPPYPALLNALVTSPSKPPWKPALRAASPTVAPFNLIPEYSSAAVVALNMAACPYALDSGATTTSATALAVLAAPTAFAPAETSFAPPSGIKASPKELETPSTVPAHVAPAFFRAISLTACASSEYIAFASDCCANQLFSQPSISSAAAGMVKGRSPIDSAAPISPCPTALTVSPQAVESLYSCLARLAACCPMTWPIAFRQRTPAAPPRRNFSLASLAL